MEHLQPDQEPDSGRDDDFAPIVGGVSGLIVQDGNVLLIRRGKQPYKDHWSLPGGGVERGERLREAAKREVLEETGLDVEVGLVAGYREEIHPDGHYVVLAFHGAVVGGELRAGDDAAAVEFVDPRALAGRLTVPALEDVFRDAGLLDGGCRDPRRGRHQT
jgi:ADP-ribose pyrophosphatase YjhB (NUDIX family)